MQESRGKPSGMSIEQRLRAKLEAAFAPSFLAIENDSARHAGHASATHHARGPGVVSGETHFSVTIEAAAFVGKSRLDRQRMVFAALAEEMAGPVHALSVKARAPQDPLPR